MSGKYLRKDELDDKMVEECGRIVCKYKHYESERWEIGQVIGINNGRCHVRTKGGAIIAPMYVKVMRKDVEKAEKGRAMTIQKEVKRLAEKLGLDDLSVCYHGNEGSRKPGVTVYARKHARYVKFISEEEDIEKIWNDESRSGVIDALKKKEKKEVKEEVKEKEDDIQG